MIKNLFETGVIRLEEVYKAIIKQATHGDIRAFQVITERMDRGVIEEGQEQASNTHDLLQYDLKIMREHSDLVVKTTKKQP